MIKKFLDWYDRYTIKLMERDLRTKRLDTRPKLWWLVKN